MFKSKKYYINSEKGFALVLALIACLILVALGALVINLSTGDLKTSGQILGEKTTGKPITIEAVRVKRKGT